MRIYELKAEDPRMLGPVLVAEEYGRCLGMTGVLKGCEMSKKESEGEGVWEIHRTDERERNNRPETVEHWGSWEGLLKVDGSRTWGR